MGPQPTTGHKSAAEGIHEEGATNGWLAVGEQWGRGGEAGEDILAAYNRASTHSNPTPHDQGQYEYAILVAAQGQH